MLEVPAARAPAAGKRFHERPAGNQEVGIPLADGQEARREVRCQADPRSARQGRGCHRAAAWICGTAAGRPRPRRAKRQAEMLEERRQSHTLMVEGDLTHIF